MLARCSTVLGLAGVGMKEIIQKSTEKVFIFENILSHQNREGNCPM